MFADPVFINPGGSTVKKKKKKKRKEKKNTLFECQRI